MTVGERIKELRKSKGMNAERLAELCGCSAATMYRYEKGEIEKIEYTRLAEIAEALNTTPAYLAGAEEEKPLVNNDEELTDYLEYLRDREELRMLFSVTKDATRADIERAVKIIESLKGIDG